MQIMTRKHQVAILLLLQTLHVTTSPHASVDDYEGVFQLKIKESCVAHSGQLEVCDKDNNRWKAIPDDLVTGTCRF